MGFGVGVGGRCRFVVVDLVVLVIYGLPGGLVSGLEGLWV